MGSSPISCTPSRAAGDLNEPSGIIEVLAPAKDDGSAAESGAPERPIDGPHQNEVVWQLGRSSSGALRLLLYGDKHGPKRWRLQRLRELSNQRLVGLRDDL